MPILPIHTWSDIPRTISILQQGGAGHRVPLLQAVYRGRLAHLEMQRSCSASLFKRWAALTEPAPAALALIGDDDHAAPYDGPDSWPIATRALWWARAVLIHGGAGQAEHYEQAIALAEKYGKLTMVECSSVNVEAWQQLTMKWAPRAVWHVMQPPPGVPHPTVRSREEML